MPKQPYPLGSNGEALALYNSDQNLDKSLATRNFAKLSVLLTDIQRKGRCHAGAKGGIKLADVSLEEIIMHETCKPRALDLIGKPSYLRNMCVFQAYESMRPGCSFEFSYEVEPTEVYSQLFCEHLGEFIWENLPSGPGVWRVLVTKKISCAPSKQRITY